jgi:transcriptional regulator with XRE-family HTH domain
MSPEQLAAAVFVSDSLVRAWERNRRIPKPDVLAKVEALLGTQGILGRILNDLVDASVPVEWFTHWVEIEREASALWSFELAVFPGLLQTPEYARAVLKAANHVVDLDESVTARIERKRTLTDEDPPMLVAIIAESVLNHNVGGNEVMTEQLESLLTQGSNVIIHIIPDASECCSGFIGAFAIARTPKGDFAYVDNQLNGEVIEDSEDVTRLHRWYDTFRADALSRSDSQARIQEAIEQWKLK